MEQFAATRLDLAEVREQLPPEGNVTDWENSLISLREKIERLGAVNLASIDELKEQTERKEYLDRQFADLTEALGGVSYAYLTGPAGERFGRSRLVETAA